MTTDERIVHIKVLRQEVETLTKRLRPNGTGYLHTTIDTLNSRIDELIKNGMIDERLDMEEKLESHARKYGRNEYPTGTIAPQGSRSMQEKYGRAVETVYNPSKEI